MSQEKRENYPETQKIKKYHKKKGELPRNTKIKKYRKKKWN